MSTQAAATLKSTGGLARYNRAPFVALLTVGAILLWKALAHSLSVLLDHFFPDGQMIWIGAAMGITGFALIWNGFKRDEVPATLMGFAGGSLIWIGWMEQSFYGFSDFLQIPPYEWQGFTLLTPNLLLMQATLVPFLVLLIFMGANKDTRCRMFLWFHRHFRLRPAKPTQGYKRQFSRITAMEHLFVTWFFYILNIMLFDPRVLGPYHPATYAAFGIALVWVGYLWFFKMWPQKAMGYAFRYAIPTGSALWLAVEMASLWQWITEIWLYPLKYPVSMSIMLLVFVACFYAIYAIPKAAAARS